MQGWKLNFLTVLSDYIYLLPLLGRRRLVFPRCLVPGE